MPYSNICRMQEGVSAVKIVEEQIRQLCTQWMAGNHSAVLDHLGEVTDPWDRSALSVVIAGRLPRDKRARFVARLWRVSDIASPQGCCDG